MAVSQYEKDRIARVEKRKNKSKPKKPVYVSPKTDRQKAQDDINTYKMQHYGKPSSSEQPSTAISGGSKAVRKVTSKESPESLVEKLRKKPFKYIK